VRLVIGGLALFLAIAVGACGNDDMTGGSEPVAEEHAVILHFVPATDLSTDVYELEDELNEVLTSDGLGDVDGNEIALDGSEVLIYAYGADADAMFEAMRPVLRRLGAPRDSYAIKRYGAADNPDARQVRVDFKAL
jgi:hypothetical protein